MAAKKGTKKMSNATPGFIEKPKVKLVGTDGNAFAILGTCIKVARKAGWTKEKIKQFQDEATSGDYDNLLRTCMVYFDVR